jgi:Nif-specific regulatory protein
MPALREIRSDINLIANYYLNVFKREKGVKGLKISGPAMKKILDYRWPGNVRELKNALERAVVMGNGDKIMPEDLPISAPTRTEPGVEVGLSFREAVDNFKKGFIVENLKHTRGNRSKAAKVMGIQRTYLARLISKYGIQEQL